MSQLADQFRALFCSDVNYLKMAAKRFFILLALVAIQRAHSGKEIQFTALPLPWSFSMYPFFRNRDKKKKKTLVSAMLTGCFTSHILNFVFNKCSTDYWG